MSYTKLGLPLIVSCNDVIRPQLCYRRRVKIRDFSYGGILPYTLTLTNFAGTVATLEYAFAGGPGDALQFQATMNFLFASGTNFADYSTPTSLNFLFGAMIVSITNLGGGVVEVQLDFGAAYPGAPCTDVELPDFAASQATWLAYYSGQPVPSAQPAPQFTIEVSEILTTPATNPAFQVIDVIKVPAHECTPASDIAVVPNTPENLTAEMTAVIGPIAADGSTGAFGPPLPLPTTFTLSGGPGNPYSVWGYTNPVPTDLITDVYMTIRFDQHSGSLGDFDAVGLALFDAGGALIPVSIITQTYSSQGPMSTFVPFVQAWRFQDLDAGNQFTVGLHLATPIPANQVHAAVFASRASAGLIDTIFTLSSVNMISHTPARCVDLVRIDNCGLVSYEDVFGNPYTPGGAAGGGTVCTGECGCSDCTEVVPASCDIVSPPLENLGVVWGSPGQFFGQEPRWGRPLRTSLKILTVSGRAAIIPGPDQPDVFVYRDTQDPFVSVQPNPISACAPVDFWIKNRSLLALTVQAGGGATIEGQPSITLQPINPAAYPWGNDGGQGVHLVYDPEFNEFLILAGA